MSDDRDFEACLEIIDGRDAEIDRLRAELAEWQQKAGGYNACNLVLERNNAAKDARIAACNNKIGELEALRIHLEACNREAALDCKGLRARIAELQSGAERYWEGRWRDADVRITELEAELDQANFFMDEHKDSLARAERAEAHYTDAVADIREWKLAAERAEATVVELQTELADWISLEDSRRHDRERTEAERDEALKLVPEKAMMRAVELLAEANTRAERAEAHIRELNDKWANDVLLVECAEAERGRGR